MELNFEKATKFNKQIKDINTKIEIINNELNQIKKINEIIILNIQEIIDRLHLT